MRSNSERPKQDPRADRAPPARSKKPPIIYDPSCPIHGVRSPLARCKECTKEAMQRATIVLDYDGHRLREGERPGWAHGLPYSPCEHLRGVDAPLAREDVTEGHVGEYLLPFEPDGTWARYLLEKAARSEVGA
jgi:hypothetical protein